jgi:hypothetical protein
VVDMVQVRPAARSAGVIARHRSRLVEDHSRSLGLVQCTVVATSPTDHASEMVGDHSADHQAPVSGAQR